MLVRVMPSDSTMACRSRIACSCADALRACVEMTLYTASSPPQATMVSRTHARTHTHTRVDTQPTKQPPWHQAILIGWHDGFRLQWCSCRQGLRRTNGGGRTAHNKALQCRAPVDLDVCIGTVPLHRLHHHFCRKTPTHNTVLSTHRQGTAIQTHVHYQDDIAAKQ